MEVETPFMWLCVANMCGNGVCVLQCIRKTELTYS